MKRVKPASAGRGVEKSGSPTVDPNTSLSNPEFLTAAPQSKSHDKPDACNTNSFRISPRSPRNCVEGSSSESKLFTKQNDPGFNANRIDPKARARGDGSPKNTKDMQAVQSPDRKRHIHRILYQPGQTKTSKPRNHFALKKSRSCSPVEFDAPLTRQIRDIHNDMRASAHVIRNSRSRLLELQKKSDLAESDIKELSDRHELLLREMERFDRLTRNVQRLVDMEVGALRKNHDPPCCEQNYQPNIVCGPREPVMNQDLKSEPPTVSLIRYPGAPHLDRHHNMHHQDTTRSKSEIDLTRKLSESYDMQEKLVADNADLEVKRYMLYKELMTKDQNLETCRGQIKRLQAELKMISKENSHLHERIIKNHPEGDATATNENPTSQNQLDNNQEALEYAQQLAQKLDEYQSSNNDLEKQLSGLEEEVNEFRSAMDAIKKVVEANAGKPACRGGLAPNTCYGQQPGGGPPVPPLMKACGVCPPCPAPCNPNAAPTPAEREVGRLTIQLRQTEENFKTKVTECALLRAELLKKKEELEKEVCQHRELQNKFRELEMKFEGLGLQTNTMLGTKEHMMQQEISVRTLKQCYREAREEIDELRTLVKEQNDQVQDYRVKYMAAQQLVEEQKRQMDMMDMDNTRISEQINLEIQKVKLKFQEKLQELAPIPELLRATQLRLKDAQQSQALAEHNAEQLARELNCAREKVHALLHNAIKPVEKPPDRSGDEKVLNALQQRITQLTDNIVTLKAEIERLKSNVIRLEEVSLTNEKRLQEKMHECAQLGGELDKTRDEAARAVNRASERMETVRKCMQTTIAELERQLAAARAQIKTSEKEREEIQTRMNCQIQRLRGNFDQAQLRIMGLNSQIQTLRRTASSTDGDGDMAQCQCKTLFDDP